MFSYLIRAFNNAGYDCSVKKSSPVNIHYMQKAIHKAQKDTFHASACYVYNCIYHMYNKFNNTVLYNVRYCTSNSAFFYKTST
jgi:hypothetical protein